MINSTYSQTIKAVPGRVDRAMLALARYYQLHPHQEGLVINYITDEEGQLLAEVFSAIDRRRHASEEYFGKYEQPMP